MAAPSELDNWLRRLELRHPSTIELGLERVGEVWRRLGAPRVAKQIFTVAGTNGKGSTVAYIDAMVRSLGYHSGTYTSPHVFHYNERLRLDGKTLADEQWVVAFEQVEQARQEIGLTYFEHGTLAAFLMLAEAKLDFAVLEVGLGGRLDAVNIVDADCAVLTAIGLDHQEYLGNDRESIGREKAGILRAGIPLVCGDVDPPQSVSDRAAELDVPVWVLGRDFTVAEQGEQLLWSQGSRTVLLPRPPLTGPHQFNNLASSFAAVMTLLPVALQKSIALGEAISQVRLAGRMQTHPADARVIIDVGHNPLAAEVVAAALETSGREAAFCVLAMLKDKDAAEVVRILEGVVHQWHCAGLEGDRGRSGHSLAETVSRLPGQHHVKAFATVSEALQAACIAASETDTVLVFGSFLTAAQALETDLADIKPASRLELA